MPQWHYIAIYIRYRVYLDQKYLKFVGKLMGKLDWF